MAETKSSGVLSQFLQGDTGYATPDVSRVQALAIGQAVVALAVVLGFDLSDDVQTAIIVLASVLGLALPASDAAVRRARAQNINDIAAAKQLERVAAVEATGPDFVYAELRLRQAELALAEDD
jgi:hypothetical protein